MKIYKIIIFAIVTLVVIIGLVNGVLLFKDLNDKFFYHIGDYNIHYNFRGSLYITSISILIGSLVGLLFIVFAAIPNYRLNIVSEYKAVVLKTLEDIALQDNVKEICNCLLIDYDNVDWIDKSKIKNESENIMKKFSDKYGNKKLREEVENELCYNKIIKQLEKMDLLQFKINQDTLFETTLETICEIDITDSNFYDSISKYIKSNSEDDNAEWIDEYEPTHQEEDQDTRREDIRIIISNFLKEEK